MTKTNFADPYDDFDDEFVEWVAELLKDFDDVDSFSDYDNSQDDFFWIKELKGVDFDDE